MKYLLFAVAAATLLNGCVVKTDPHHHHGRVVEVRKYHGHPHHKHHDVKTKETIKIKKKN